MNRRSIISLFIGFMGRAYILFGIIWLSLIVAQNDKIKYLDEKSPWLVVIFGVILAVLYLLLGKSKLQFLSMFEIKQSSFSVQIVILLVIGVLEILTSRSVEVGTDWAMASIIMAIVDFLGIMFTKHAGATTKEASSESVKTTIVASIVLGGVAVLGIYLLKPISTFVGMIWGGVVKVIKFAIQKIIWFFNWLSSLVYHGEPIEHQNETPSYMEDFVFEYKETSEIALKIVVGFFALLAIIAFIILFIAIIKYLAKRSFRKRQAKLTGESIESMEFNFKDFLNEIARFFRSIGHKIKANVRVIRHPKSVAAVMVKLERKMFKRPILRRREYETPTEFVNKLREKYRGEREELFDSFIEAINSAIYGQNKSWLTEYPAAKEFIKEVSKKV